MLFSVCIPVYNTSQYLEECLESVLCQSEKDYEIVLVDDGSTDNSPQICDRYAEKYPNIRVIHKSNEGLMMTRRRGFSEARGDFFICLDSDDYLCDLDALKRIREMIEKENCDLVVYNYIAGKENPEDDQLITLFDHPDGYVLQGEDKTELYNKLLLGRDFNVWIKAVSRSLVDLNVDYNKWKHVLINSQGEDLLQSLPIIDAAEKVVYLKEPLYFYRWNEKSISRNIRPEYYYAYRAIYRRTDEYLNKWEFDGESIRKIDQKRINMILSVLLAKHRDKKKWMEVLRNAADDEFFRKLWKKINPADISKYYQFAGNLIFKKHFFTLRIVITSVRFLSRVKGMLSKGGLYGTKG